MTARIRRNRRPMFHARVPVGMALGSGVLTASVGPVARNLNVDLVVPGVTEASTAPMESAVPDAVKASGRIPRVVKMPVGREGDSRKARRGRKSPRPISG